MTTVTKNPPSPLPYSLIAVLFLLYPFNYLTGHLAGNSLLYIVKDMYIIALVAVLLIVLLPSQLVFDRVHIYFLGLLIFATVIATAHFENPIFLVFGLREMVILPPSFVLLGYVTVYRYGIEGYYKLLLYSLLVAVALTCAFTLVFPAESFGGTDRLRSFWDSVHEPGIIAGLLLIYILAMRPLRTPSTNGGVAVVACLVVILSGSRSVYAAIFGAVALLALYYNPKRVAQLLLVFAAIVVAFLTYYDTISTRPLLYNLHLRFQQWSLAAQLFSENPLFGIGVDKYGAVGPFRRVYEQGGITTTTMDSSLIKYTVNLGLFYILAFLSLVGYSLVRVNNLRIDTSHKQLLTSVIVYSLIIGAVTGKLGAFPLNMYFYSAFGAAMTLPLATKIDDLEIEQS